MPNATVDSMNHEIGFCIYLPRLSYTRFIGQVLYLKSLNTFLNLEQALENYQYHLKRVIYRFIIKILTIHFIMKYYLEFCHF